MLTKVVATGRGWSVAYSGNLMAAGSHQDSVQLGKVSHKLKLGGNDDFEVLEHPGGYASRFDGVNKAGRLRRPLCTVNLASASPGLAFTTSTSASWLSVTSSTGTIPYADARRLPIVPKN
jgi:hypothetical protein